MQHYTPDAVYRMCTSKRVGCATKGQAKRLARELGRTYGRSFKPYLCKVCRFYHLTTRKEASRG